jgi:mRNA interferase MazF
MTTHIILDDNCGLSEPSMIVLEQLRTIDRVEELGRYIGTISDEIKRNEIKQGLKHLVGILRKPRRERVGRISTLCINCQKELMKNPDNMIRRIDPWQREKDLCDKCQTNYGYDYLITKKYKHTENREVKKL